MASRSDQASNLLFTLTRLVIPPEPVKFMIEGNLYIRCNNGKKEFVRKLPNSRTCNMTGRSRGNRISPLYDTASRSLAELERHRTLLLEERALRERLDQQERIGFRTRRPYRWNRSSSFSSSPDGPRPTPVLQEPVPAVIHRHPQQYRRRRSSNMSAGSTCEKSGNEVPTRHQCPPNPGHSSRVRFEPETMHCTPASRPMPPRPPRTRPHAHSPSHRHHPRHTGNHDCPRHHGHHRHSHQRPHFDHFNDSSDEEGRSPHTFIFFPGMTRRHDRRHGSHGLGCPRALVEERRPQDYE